MRYKNKIYSKMHPTSCTNTRVLIMGWSKVQKIEDLEN